MFKKILEQLSRRNTLYYPGCLTKFALKDIKRNYKEILRRLKVDFIVLKDLELCCGSPVLNAGYKRDFEKLKERNLELFREYSINKIITNCPGCFHIFLNEYKFSSIRVEHITQTIFENIKELKKEKSDGKRKISYHDPCHLGRYNDIYEEPRKILNALGFNVKELWYKREESLCCGAGGGLKSNFPRLSNKIAKTRLSELKARKLVTTCPLCFLHLKENSEDENIEILELSEVVLNGL
jgi:Fe-S oxidoreductase